MVSILLDFSPLYEAYSLLSRSASSNRMVQVCHDEWQCYSVNHLDERPTQTQSLILIAVATVQGNQSNAVIPRKGPASGWNVPA